LAYFVIATLLLVTADCTETSKDTARSALKMALYLLPALAIFLLIERAYHYYRFREIFSTYLDIQIRQGLARGGFYVGGDGYAPPGWPWLTPFWDGLKSHFLSLQYGILYFDPILVPSVYILIRYGVLIGRAHINWKMVAAHATAWLVLMADAVFYAKYYEPGGMAHWGDRYVAVGAVMTTMLAGGLYAQIFRRLRSWERWLLNSVFALSLAVQISSLFFPTWLEIAQAASGNRGLGPWMRIKNISAFFLNWPFDFGTVKALDPKAAELNFMVTKIAGIAHLSPKAYATALALWMAAIVTVLVALFRITAREAETPQEREVVPGFETGAPI
jgi:hypothetical protein